AGGRSARRGGRVVSAIRTRPPASHALAPGGLRGRPEGMTMPTVVLAAYNTAGFAEGGGHFWVYLQYVLGLRQLGCDVYWLEGFRTTGRADRDAAALATFRERMQRYGLGAKFFVFRTDAETPPSELPTRYVDAKREEAEAGLHRAAFP